MEAGAEEAEDLGISVWQGGPRMGGKLQHTISRRMKTRFCESSLIGDFRECFSRSLGRRQVGRI